MSWPRFALLFLALFLASCEEEQAPSSQIHSIPGEIQILNSCGMPKVATQLRELLIANGFDVVEVGNGSDWNYDETIIALRNPHWPGGKALAELLKTKNVIPLENSRKMVDATIYIGRDITKVLENE